MVTLVLVILLLRKGMKSTEGSSVFFQGPVREPQRTGTYDATGACYGATRVPVGRSSVAADSTAATLQWRRSQL